MLKFRTKATSTRVRFTASIVTRRRNATVNPQPIWLGNARLIGSPNTLASDLSCRAFAPGIEGAPPLVEPGNRGPRQRHFAQVSQQLRTIACPIAVFTSLPSAAERCLPMFAVHQFFYKLHAFEVQ